MGARFDPDQMNTLTDPAGVRAFYAHWAAFYDNDFIREFEYVAPREIARIFREESGGKQPALDVGAGTGALGEHLRGYTIDAVDVSAEMLAIADEKRVYRNSRVSDAMRRIRGMRDRTYRGIISCGAFRPGHLGRASFAELFRVTQPGALFVCGIDPEFIDTSGIGSLLATAVGRSEIEPVRFKEIPIYEAADPQLSRQRGLVMVFRKK